MATIDTIADRSTGTAIAGKAYFETSTNKFIVYNGSAWIELDSDGTGAAPLQNRWGADFSGGKLSVASTNDFAFGTSGFTISLWFIHDNTSQALFDFRGSAATPMVWLSGSQIKYYANSGYRITGSYTYQASTWRHLVIHNDGSGTTSMYLDNLSTPLGTFSDSISYVQAPLTIATYGSNAGGGANKIDEFSVFNSTSSLSNIADLASSGKPTDLASYGPVAWYRMGDDSNDTATSGGSIATITDSSGNGNDAVQATASSQPTFKAHALSTASLSFDASGDYLEKTFSSAPCAGAYTIGFWFNTSVNNSYLSLFENSDSLGNYNGGFRVYRFSDGSIRLATANSTGAWAHEAIAHSTSLNTWHYVVITRSAHGVSPEIYLDGVLPSGNTYGTPQTDVISATKLRIGCNQTAYSLTGYMDEVSFFNSELTGSDLTAYLSAARGTHLINDLSLSPTAYYRMGEDDGLTDGQTGISQITDASGNGNHATQATAANQPTASVGPVIYV